MARRHYINAAPQLTLNSGMTAGATTMTISGSFAGWPASVPYFAVLEYGTANMEVVLVTAVTGGNATVTRAQDGTVAVSHLAGSTVDHGAVAADLDEANNHINQTSGVHGTTSAVADVSSPQTFANKTLSSPQINTPTIASPTVTGPLSGASAGFSGAVTAGSVAASGNGTVAGVVVPKTYANLAALTAAIPSPTVGTIAYLTAPGALYVYQGTTWRQINSNSDTGWVRDTTPTPGSANWTLPYAYYRTMPGGMTCVILGARRANSAITANSAGNFTDSVVMTVSALLTPASLPVSLNAIWYSADSQSSGGAFFDATGRWVLTDGHPTSVISPGDNVQATFVYPLG